jgi:hypothetical protein
MEVFGRFSAFFIDSRWVGKLTRDGKFGRYRSTKEM